MDFNQDDEKITTGHVLMAHAVIYKASGKLAQHVAEFRARAKAEDIEGTLSNQHIRRIFRK